MIATEPAPTLLNGEKLIGLAAVAKCLPGHRENAHVNPATIFRWATKGVRLAGGAVVRLEAVKLGSGWRTSLEAVARFSAKLTNAATAPSSPPPPTPKQRKRAEAKSSRDADAIFGRRK